MDFIDQCQKFISIDSSPHAGSREIVETAREFCADVGLDVEVLDERYNGLDQANIIASNGKRNEYDLLLQTHLDTRDPGNFGLWDRTGSNPYQATIYQNKLYGLGAVEAKLDFLCKLEAIRRVGIENIKKSFVLAGTFGEELGMVGAIKLMKKKRLQVKGALVGEATDLKLVHAGKGMALVELRIPFSPSEIKFRANHDDEESISTQSRIFSGQSSHSATSDLNENAIWKMFEHLMKMPEGIAIMELEGGVNYNTVADQAFLEIDLNSKIEDTLLSKLKIIYDKIIDLQKKFDEDVDERFDPPMTTFNLGKIETRENDVLIKGCVRIPPRVDESNYLSWMGELKDTCASVDSNFTIVDYKPPYDSSSKEKTGVFELCVKAAQRVDLKSDFHTQSTTCEANVFSRVGVDCVVFGPGSLEISGHTPQEHVEIAHLEKAIEFYSEVLKG